MKIIYTKNLSSNRKSEILSLWNTEYPNNLKYSSIEEFDNYLTSLHDIEHYLLIDVANKLIGWAITFTRENENWFAIIIDSKVHGRGYGKLLLEELKKSKPILNGWVIDHDNDFKANGEIYKSPLEFYLKNDFLILDDFRIENEKISAVKVSWEKVKS